MQAEATLRGMPPDDGLGRAVVLALLLHVLLAVVLWVSSFFEWERELPAAAGLPVINADLDVSESEAAAAREALAFEPVPLPEPAPEPEDAVPPPQPLSEPLPDDSLVERQVQAQERVPVPDTEQQEEVRRDAISDETRLREQEEKRRQEQLDLTERERQREAEERQRLARQQKQEELQKIREELRKAERQTEMHEQRLRQLADARAQRASEAAAQADATASAPTGNQGVDNDLLGRYQAALIEAIRSKWTRPDSVPYGQRCRIEITQLPGGEVMNVSVSPSCPYDEAGRRSVEAAVLKAQPLPYAGFESVFRRNLTLNFEAAN